MLPQNWHELGFFRFLPGAFLLSARMSRATRAGDADAADADAADAAEGQATHSSPFAPNPLKRNVRASSSCRFFRG